MPAGERAGALRLRALIYDVAAKDPRIGPLQECLKWGQPAYVTADSKSGTTLRLGLPKTGGFAIYAHCQTSVIRDYAANFADLDRIEGNRAVQFDHADQVAPDRITQLIHHALTYHLG